MDAKGLCQTKWLDPVGQQMWSKKQFQLFSRRGSVSTAGEVYSVCHVQSHVLTAPF